MLRVLAAAHLVAAIGCSAEEAIDDTPPTLEVTSPARGTLADTETVTVTGRATDKDGPVKVTVAGVQVTPAKDGTFTATVPLAGGIALIETHAIDSAGNDVRDVRAVLSGTLAPTDGTQTGQLGARAGVTALRAVGNAIATSAKGIDYTAAALALNPVYDNGGCLGARINITSISLTDVGVGLAPKTDLLSTDVVIDNLNVRMSVRYRVACISGSTTVTVRASKTRIRGDLGLRVANMALSTSLPGATVSFEGFSLDIGGVPGALEDLVRGKARDGVAKALASAIRSKVPPIADRALAGLIAKPIDTSILGAATTISIVPKQAAITNEALFVAVDTTMNVTGGEGGTYVTTPTTLSPGMMSSSQDLGIAIDDDIVNMLFAGLWAADAFDKRVSLDTVPTLGAVLDDDARSMDIKLSLPPTASTKNGQLELALGDMIVTVRDEAGAEVQSMAISLTTAIAAEPSQSGKVLLTVGSPTVLAQVLAQSDAVDEPLTDDQVEALVTAVWGVVGVKADDALAKLPMPTIGGVSLGAPTISAHDGFVLADIAVQ